MLVTFRSGAVWKRRPTQGLGTVHVGVSISQELFVWKRRPTQGLGTAIAGVSLGSCFETKTYTTTMNRYAYEKPLYKLGLQPRQCPLLTQTSEREINYRRLWSAMCSKGK